MAFVRCAGKFAEPKVFYGDREITGVTVTTTGIPVAPSCGWKGERLASYSMYGVITHRDIFAKPCPKCGGRVELRPDWDDLHGQAVGEPDPEPEPEIPPPPCPHDPPCGETFAEVDQ